MSLKTKLKQWAQKKIKTLSAAFAGQVAYRSEYLNNCALNSNEPGVSNEKYCEKLFYGLKTI